MERREALRWLSAGFNRFLSAIESGAAIAAAASPASPPREKREQELCGLPVDLCGSDSG